MEATAVSRMGQSKCLLGKQVQIVTIHAVDVGPQKEIVKFNACWLDSIYHPCPVLRPRGLTSVDLIMVLPLVSGFHWV